MTLVRYFKLPCGKIACHVCDIHTGEYQWMNMDAAEFERTWHQEP